MATALTGNSVQSSYESLIKVGNNTTITSVLKELSDGSGIAIPMQASTTRIKFTGITEGIKTSELTNDAGFVDANITGSAIVNASATGANITFTKGDGTTFVENITAGSGGDANSIQFDDGSGNLSGTNDFTFNNSTKLVDLNGRFAYTGSFEPALPDLTNTYSGELSPIQDTELITRSVVYLNPNGAWKLTNNNLEAKTRPHAGIVIDEQNVMIRGYISGMSSYITTVGEPLYLEGGAQAGELTQTIPTTTGEFVRVMGYAVTSDVIYFNPSNEYIEL